MTPVPSVVLDPLSIALDTINSRDDTAAWSQLDRRLRKCGLERNALFSLPLGKAGYPHPDDAMGTAISPEYESYAYENPHLVGNVPGIRRLVAGDFVVAVIPGFEDFDRLSAAEIEYYREMHRFGFRGGFIASFPHRSDRSIFIFSSCSLVSAEEARRAFETAGDAAVAGVAWFLEARAVRQIRGDPTFSGLSPREGQCLALVGTGRTTQQIADRLGLSSRTVNEFISKGSAKLEAGNRTQAALRAMLLGAASSAK